MRIRRKVNACLNCKATLNSVYNYCPNCGQENNDNNVSIKTLIGDFFNTYLSIDSRFGKSFKPFFTKPGELTNEYTKGKRVAYAHPLRFYFIISIFYFFTITEAVRYMVDDEDTIIASSDVNLNLDQIEGLSDISKKQLIDVLSPGEQKKLARRIKKGDGVSLKSFLIALDSGKQSKLRDALGGELADSLGLVKELITTGTQEDDDLEVNFDFGDQEQNNEFILDKIDFTLIQKLDREHGDLADEQIYDSLHMGELNTFEHLLARQSIRITRAGSDEVMTFIAKNLPLMMLILIPLFALILKLLYIRRKELYIKHIVHALHLHTFAYFAYGIFILITVFIIHDEDLQPLINFFGFILVSGYVFLSFRRVYTQHWFKTLLKFIFVGFTYLTTIVIFFLAEMVISLLVY